MKKEYIKPFIYMSAIIESDILFGFSETETKDGPKVNEDDTVDPSESLAKPHSVWDE